MEASERRGRKRLQRGPKWVLRAEGRSYGSTDRRVEVWEERIQNKDKLREEH